MRRRAVGLGVRSMRIMESASPGERNLLRFQLTSQVPELLENFVMLEMQRSVSVCLLRLWNTVPVLEREQQTSPTVAFA